MSYATGAFMQALVYHWTTDVKLRRNMVNLRGASDSGIDDIRHPAPTVTAAVYLMTAIPAPFP
jgi:hypothetical protein